jgi:hypothetical protein
MTGGLRCIRGVIPKARAAAPPSTEVEGLPESRGPRACPEQASGASVPNRNLRPDGIHSDSFCTRLDSRARLSLHRRLSF